MAASGRHSAWCIGLSEAQRQAIFADPNWHKGDYSTHQKPDKGLAVARMIAMSTYRSWASFSNRFGRQIQSIAGDEFAITDYLQYQGKKLVERFDANTYITLTNAMDTHDLGYPDQNYQSVLQNIWQPALVVTINSDILYPPVEQEEIARLMHNGELVRLEFPHGHEAFLIDMDTLNDLVVTFRSKIECLSEAAS